MRVFTSYYGRARVLKQNGIVPISISLGNPKFMPDIDDVKEFAPDRATLKLGHAGDTKGYTEKFVEGLEKLDLDKVMEKVKAISDKHGGADVALCCYETVTDFCHRHIVADFLRKKTDLEIIEFGETRTYDAIMMVQKSFWK